ncbi:MAG: guanylate kinase [Alphaproteobacteria bacterium]|nr:guanylate kinase [Alphaproteobacteria bacterium]
MSDILHRRGLMFVLSSPSGAGKTTVSRRLLARDPNLQISISVTTRTRRPSEVDGEDYYFIDEKEFSRMTMNQELLEYARVFGNFYGTPKAPVERALDEGRDVLFDIDWQGTRQLRSNKNSRRDLVSVFILPPSMDELERRLRTRAQDSDAVVKERMAKAKDEISHWDEYDYVVVNEDLEKTLETVSAILNGERHHKKRQKIRIQQFVDALCKE